MNSDTRLELDEYLARVRTALADLPADELTELMEDVEPHVTEVFGEDGSPVERLGTPEDYAAELRATGGYPPPPNRTLPAVPRKLAGRVALWGLAITALVAFIVGAAGVGERSDNPLVAVIVFLPLFALAAWLIFTGRVRRSDIEELGEYRWAVRTGLNLLQPAAMDYLRSLRPAWTVLRIVVLALAFLATISRAPSFAVAVLIAAGVLLWTAGRVKTDRRLLAITVPGNAFVVGCGIALAVAAASNSGGTTYHGGYSGNGLSYNGSPLANVYAVGADGKAIDEFYLYDESGSPITVYRPSCGEHIDNRNRFPLPRVVYTRGMCEELTGLPFVPLPPSPSAVPSPSTTVSPAPSTTATSPPPSTTSSAPAKTSAAVPTG
ncbi:DUF1700 domain-containing protein [Actinokineospora xionganensis]|uniref:Proline-rich protein n=1 Tax=Actinokineospora xionganensis TaxID=2684470 RepID=A0ABR7LED5_9PSEU|nr:hypothetical protein [Actinokineospora xionganensis]MBC6450756.1 hypothetical protein [Actinokineospora xionganensis]